MAIVNIGGGAVVGALSETDTIQSESAAYTVQATDDLVLVTAGGSAKAITLPKANTLTAGHKICIKKVDAGAGAVTVTAAGGDTVESASTDSLASQFSTGVYEGDGVSNWVKVAKI